MVKDYYVVLGVGPEATPEEILSAYRERAKRLHPEHSGVDSRPFLEAQEAYAVLGDPGRRRRYDLSDGPRAPTGREMPVDIDLPDEAAASPGPVSLFTRFGNHSPSLDSLFDRVWSNFLDLHRPKSESAAPLVVDIPVTSGQALLGGRIDLEIPVLQNCASCHGEGRVGPFECWRCNGTGRAAVDRTIAVTYPPGDWRECVAEVGLGPLGIRNLYLEVHFRVAAWGI